MKIFVISLKNSPRRGVIKKNLEKLNLDFTFFDAFVGEKNIYFSKQYGKLFRKFFYNSDLTSGEIGCYLSHSAVWCYAIIYNEPILILEDDVIVSEQLPTLLTQLDLNWQIYKFDLLRLYGVFPRDTYKIKDNDLEFIRYFKYPRGTQAYVVKPDAAKKLLFYSRKIKFPIDDFIDRTEFLYSIKIYGIDPYLVSHDENFQSIIGDRGLERKDNKKIYVKILRELLNGYFSLRRIIYVYFHYWFQL